jgi:HEAT repeat protein
MNFIRCLCIIYVFASFISITGCSSRLSENDIPNNISKESKEIIKSILKGETDSRQEGKYYAEAEDIQEKPNPAVPFLLQDLTIKDNEKRQLLLYSLINIKDTRCVDPFILLLSNKKENADIRRIAAFGLGELKDKKAESILIASLHDIKDDPHVRVACAAAIVLLDPDKSYPILLKNIDDKDVIVQRAIYALLGATHNSEAFLLLSRIALDRNRDIRDRSAAIVGLHKSEDNRAVDLFIQFAEDKDEEPDIREDAISAIASNADPNIATEHLILILKQKDSGLKSLGVSGLAVDKLQLIGGDKVEIALMEAYNGVDPPIKLKILFTLGQMRAKNALPFLEKLLYDTDKDISWWAIKAICDVGDPSSIDILKQISQDTKYSIYAREYVKNALDQVEKSKNTQIPKQSPADTKKTK